MEVSCPSCQGRYQVPDDKLPPGGIAFVTCPRCKDRFEVRAPGQAPDGSQPVTSVFFDPEIPTATVFCPDLQAVGKIEKGLKTLGFDVRMVDSATDFANQFQYANVDLVVLYQKGPEREPELDEILSYLHSLPMGIRRDTFVVYAHLAGNRLDTMKAFGYGVELTINPMDIAKLPEILPKSMEAKQVFYRPFVSTQEKMGEEAL